MVQLSENKSFSWHKWSELSLRWSKNPYLICPSSMYSICFMTYPMKIWRHIQHIGMFTKHCVRETNSRHIRSKHLIRSNTTSVNILDVYMHERPFIKHQSSKHYQLLSITLYTDWQFQSLCGYSSVLIIRRAAVTARVWSRFAYRKQSKNYN